MQATINTGLILKLNDEATPDVLVKLPYLVAELWLGLFDKLIGKTLEKTAEPKELIEVKFEGRTDRRGS